MADVELTPTQRHLFCLARNAIVEHIQSPYIRGLGAAMQFSINAVRWQLQQLQKLGLITIDATAPRGISLTELGAATRVEFTPIARTVRRVGNPSGTWLHDNS